MKRFLTILFLFISVVALGQSAARKLLMAQGETEKWYKILDLDIYADGEVEGYITVRSFYTKYDFKRVIVNSQGSFEVIENDTNEYAETVTVDENTQKIEIYTNNSEAIFSDLYISNIPLQYLDVSTPYFVNSSFNLSYMPNLTDITFPQSTERINSLTLVSLGLTGELDLSWVEERFAMIFLRDLDITSLKFNENANEVSITLLLDNLSLEGVLDLTQFEIMSEILVVTNMPNVEEILFYENVEATLYHFTISNTGINTDLDISMFNNFTDGVNSFALYDNKYAGEVIFPNSFGDGEFNNIYLRNNGTLAGTPSIPSSSVLSLFTKGMFDYDYFTINVSSMGWDATQVNQALQIIDNNSSSGYISRELTINNNTAPTGAGITAKNSLTNKGWTVLTD